MQVNKVKTILCYGDSNTFGTNPHGGRWDFDIRWTGRIQKILGPYYRIIEEGCGGRTTVWNDDLEPHRNGKEYLPVALSTHKPIDVVILMLGTNDFKARFKAMPKDIAEGIRQLVEMIQTYPYGDFYTVPQIVLVSPIYIGDGIENSTFSGFDNSAVDKSKLMADLIKKVADNMKCHFMDAAIYASPSEYDSLHLEAEEHEILAEAIATKIKLLDEK